METWFWPCYKEKSKGAEVGMAAGGSTAEKTDEEGEAEEAK